MTKDRVLNAQEIFSQDWHLYCKLVIILLHRITNSRQASLAVAPVVLLKNIDASEADNVDNGTGKQLAKVQITRFINTRAFVRNPGQTTKLLNKANNCLEKKQMQPISNFASKLQYFLNYPSSVSRHLVPSSWQLYVP